MNKLVCGILTLTFCLCCASALALDLSDIPEVRWEFSVSLTELKSQYAMLVNGDNLLDESFKPDPLVKVTGVKRATSAAVYLEKTAAEALQSMFNAAGMVTEFTYVNEKGKEKVATYGDKGMVLYLKSGYRSYGTQATTYANYLARNNNVDDGYVAKPGSSEHQSGLCADILNDTYAGRPTMTQDFKWTPEAQWMKANCAEFGFILRFLEEAEEETGIKFEPWHFRYVGKEIASYIMSRGITLEAFTEEANEAIADFEANGGDVEEQLAFEAKRLNAPPESFVLDEYGEDGDAEISLMF
ncbi:MAG: M15 family metallopeptidase [Clostridiales bacterium]|nr:M15 family metallopeptidase [Clostridiales bacterium]